MRRFFTEPNNVKDNIAEIYEDSRHIKKVLRMNIGDEVIVFDGTGWEYTAKLESIEKNVCRARITEKTLSLSEPKTRIILFQGLPKSGKMEAIIQKAVELGVFEIVPVAMERCVTRITDAQMGKAKAERWNKISVEAAKQCGRGKIPKVLEPVDFFEAIQMMKKAQLQIMPYEGLGHQGRLGLKELLTEKKAESVALLVGPEGGFSEEEVSLAQEKGIKTVGLGKRILRTETVASAVIPVIMYTNDEF